MTASCGAVRPLIPIHKHLSRETIQDQRSIWCCQHPLVHPKFPHQFFVLQIANLPVNTGAVFFIGALLVGVKNRPLESVTRIGGESCRSADSALPISHALSLPFFLALRSAVLSGIRAGAGTEALEVAVAGCVVSAGVVTLTVQATKATNKGINAKLERRTERMAKTPIVGQKYTIDPAL